MRPYLLPHYTTATLVTGGRPSSRRSKDWPESWLAQIVPSVKPAKHSEVSSGAMTSPRGMPTQGGRQALRRNLPRAPAVLATCDARVAALGTAPATRANRSDPAQQE